MEWDTADVKPCPHGFVFHDQCGECQQEYQEVTVCECPACTGRGKLKLPIGYRDASDYETALKTCRKCHGKGFV